MKLISVIGCGYLGAVHAACMAELGHTVIGLDTDTEKIAELAAGRAPFYEPGLNELLERNVAAGRLKFTSKYRDIADADVHFIAVGTPQLATGEGADLRFVDAASDALAAVLPRHRKVAPLIAGKSTVPVGTASRLAKLFGKRGAVLAWNPEFLREGFAVKDTLSPDRIVYGLPEKKSEAKLAEKLLDEVYARLLDEDIPKITADYATAELVKTSANAFLATKISFINAMAELCDATGADVTTLAKAIGHDDRIGKKFLRAGVGFGGGCLPKDIRAFIARAEELGAGRSLEFLRNVDAVNSRQRMRAVELLQESLDRPLEGATIAVLGAAFKPDSDDIRDSPALDIAAKVAELGATVRVTDPQAVDNVRRRQPERLVVDTVDEAIEGADAVMVLTEWKEYRKLNPKRVGKQVANKLVIDGRNCLEQGEWRDAGWQYVGMGRR
ncbi:UDP-glucose dehydrogenase family protein [Gulosibacter molinativorax]|uniref:UDP-glucose 6-dehydrogenase n=1 Tax=Gulosibacter molinativorax TaxID=256821 RepID=A0ABT7C7Y7_9MICO|nr:UDP-glucose/GDP-mannose dehydrogenase family protein [Gulosibacter molinativorax]MDJ1371320.1 UDP-glucose/GDP-mannose dehydrogenase family protein [Gulosibacter molinativorax]QUY63616.1 UDP-glucose 6-dehydrogenase TuaD [Gulosibacter molinativorax]